MEEKILNNTTEEVVKETATTVKKTTTVKKEEVKTSIIKCVTVLDKKITQFKDERKVLISGIELTIEIEDINGIKQVVTIKEQV